MHDYCARMKAEDAASPKQLRRTRSRAYHTCHDYKRTATAAAVPRARTTSCNGHGPCAGVDGRCWHGRGYDDVDDSGVALTDRSFLCVLDRSCRNGKSRLPRLQA
jgi:hypothetical protein